MEELFTAQALISLVTLTTLEIILGVDNVIFVSIIMGRIAEADQRGPARLWMVCCIITWVCLLIALGWLLQQKGKPVFTLVEKVFDLASLGMLAGGLFLLVKTVTEIHHKL